MNRLDYGYVTLTKYGEELCGDNVAINRKDNEITLTLADGLGSGVKANILSILTCKMLTTMLSNNVSIEECVNTIAKTLPVCKQREVAYSTFTAIHIDDNGSGYMIEFDNPDAILIKNNKCGNFVREKIDIAGKLIYKTKLNLQPNEYVLVMSDGATHAGVGLTLNSGWKREAIMQHLDRRLKPDLSATELALMVASACNDLYLNQPSDDTSCMAAGLKKQVFATVMIGPPAKKNTDNEVVTRLLDSKGYKIVSGGTTAKIVASFMGQDIDMNYPIIDNSVPPISAIKGIDLVTEGAITINKLCHLIKGYKNNFTLNCKTFSEKDGASLLADILLNKATDIELLIGQSMNEANQKSAISVEQKQKNINYLIKSLSQLGKKVNAVYY